jgi:hypothetical protein
VPEKVHALGPRTVAPPTRLTEPLVPLISTLGSMVLVAVSWSAPLLAIAIVGPENTLAMVITPLLMVSEPKDKALFKAVVPPV